MPLFGAPDVAGLKAKGDVQGLIRALGHGPDTSVRRAAATALGELGDRRAVEPLSLALRNPDWEHDWRDVAAAADALARLGAPSVGPLIAALAYHSTVVRVSAAEALGAIGRPAVGPLVALLGDADLETRETAAQVLSDIGADAIDELVEALDDESTGRRLWVAEILGRIGDPQAVEPLIRALNDRLSGVRQAAAESLAKMADPRVGDALVVALRDPDGGVRRSAALALGEMRDPRAVQTLLPELRRAGWESAVDALVKIGVPAVKPMIAMLSDSKARGDNIRILDELRSKVGGALARIGYPEEVATLVPQLFAEQTEAQSEAASELTRLDQSGVFDARAKELILAVWPTIEQALEAGLSEGRGDPD